MIQGTFNYRPADYRQVDTCSSTVSILVQKQKIEEITIAGRPELERELYKEKQGDATLQVRHVVSVELIKKDLIKKYVHQPVVSENSYTSASQQDLQVKVDAFAQKIFQEYRDRVTKEDNLFIGNKAENEGSYELLKKLNLEKMIKEGKNAFKAFKVPLNEKKEADKKIIAFLNQIPELKAFLKTSADPSSALKLRLDIASWKDLCFLYENTLIDYKEYKYHERAITEGQIVIDKLYEHRNFDTSLREQLKNKRKQEGQKTRAFFNQYMIKKPRLDKA